MVRIRRSLLLAAKIEHQLGNRNAESSYAMRLKGSFRMRLKYRHINGARAR